MSAAHPWWLEPASAAGAGVVRALGATWRLARVGMEGPEAAIARGEGCIVAFWHARLLPLVFTHRRRGTVVLVSRHRDGELITRIIERLGFLTERGSSTRGGGEGARRMMRHAGARRMLAITPDGPRGPALRVKPGLVWLASRSGLPVVPVATAASRAWRMGSWDGFRVPRPFARVVVGYGEPIAIPRDLDDASAERWRVRIEEAIAGLTDAFDARAGALRSAAPARAGAGQA
jgi:lysophospholipid acyltransferase (LPLAT)-like uncharacterized protein